MAGIHEPSDKAKSVEKAVKDYKGLSAAQTKSRILKGQEPDGGDDESTVRDDSHGNTRLPFGLCKKYSIALPEDSTPRDAWNALKGIGITPEQVYADLERRSKKNGDHAQAIQGESATSLNNSDRKTTATSHMNEQAKAHFIEFQARTSGKHLLHEEAIACSSDGNVVLSKRGASHKVSFTLREAEQLHGADLIHNHPSHCSILSPNDADSLYDQVKSCTMCDLDGNRMSIVYADDITVQERIRFANAYAVAFGQAQKVAMKLYLKNPDEFRSSLYSDIKRRTRYYQDYAKFQQTVKDEIMKWAQENAAKYKVEIYYESN